MDVINNKNDLTRRSFQQFIFPFTLEGNKIETFVKNLLEDNFVFLNLKDMKHQGGFYGDHKVLHRKLEKYFMPYIEPILFPSSSKQKEGLRRFTKKLDIRCTFESPYLNTPFFIDEKMYVISYIALPENRNISKNDLYRASELNGYDSDGEPYIGASNPDYIERYYQERVYDRWAKETYYVTSVYNFACVTKATGKLGQELASEMYGQHFYALLLYLYYKIVLLKLAHEHSRIDVEKDQTSTEQLIFMITEFSAKYLFTEVNSTATGKELFKMTGETFRIAPLYKD
ncbi:hypothetical protein [Peribacillus sp. NPDC096540]|uniref:hypothetical protein n=1 Tax=Peribacillus sp. NPDC096540 TaxID=3390612 RepID=UPI003D086693